MLAIRTAVPEDALSVGAIRVESWRATYKDFVPQAALAAMRAEEIVERWRSSVAAGGTVLIAESEGLPVGFAGFGGAREPGYGYSGELYTIYFRPAAIGKGFGHALFSAAIDTLAAQGHGDMILWTFEENRSAHRFYEQRGGRRIDGARKITEIGGKDLVEIAYGFRPLPESASRR